MAKQIVRIPILHSARAEQRASCPEIRIDSIRISAGEYVELERLTLRHAGDADAIFGVDCDGELFAGKRYGKNPRQERMLLGDDSWPLVQVARSLRRYRNGGGRLFVDLDGAYWKSNTEGVERKRFAEWDWKDEPPEARPECTGKNWKQWPKLMTEYNIRKQRWFGPIPNELSLVNR